MKLAPKKGRYLISEPFLNDPNFKRSVVLLTEHNAEGSIGFILNKPIAYRLNEIVEDFPEFDAPVYMGGPVQQDSLHFIHRIKELAEEGDEIAPGVFWGGNFEKLKLMIIAGDVQPDDIRFFIGYSGWAPNQLDGELKQKSWIISPSKVDFTFFGEYAELWRELMVELGGKYKQMANFPVDPSLN